MMKCPNCGSEVFYLDVDITCIVKGNVAYINDKEGYIGVRCAKCGEYEVIDGMQLLRGITLLKHNNEDMGIVNE